MQSENSTGCVSIVTTVGLDGRLKAVLISKSSSFSFESFDFVIAGIKKSILNALHTLMNYVFDNDTVLF